MTGTKEREQKTEDGRQIHQLLVISYSVPRIPHPAPRNP